jgi:hypothetical protein
MGKVSPQSTRPRGSLAVAVAPFVVGAAMLVVALLLGSGRPSASAPAPATLQVFTRLLPGAAYIEGAIDFVVIEDEEGRAVLEEDFEVMDPAKPQLIRQLPAGTYVLRHYQRPCSLSCDRLGPQVDECRRLLFLPPGAVVEATVSIKAGNPCSIDLLTGG